MNYLSIKELKKAGFKKVGKNVQVSNNVNFYNFKGSIGSNCRIDDHTILIGSIDIGNYVHIAAYNLLSASKYKKKIIIFLVLDQGVIYLAQLKIILLMIYQTLL